MTVQNLQCDMQLYAFNNLKIYFKQKTEISLISYPKRTDMKTGTKH